MSLINDALKKAGQTPAPTTPADIKEPLRVATHTRPARWPMFVVPPVVAMVFAAGTFMVMRGWQGSRAVSAKETQQLSEKKIEANARVEATPPPVTNVPATVAAVAPVFPTLKLQGIIWNPKRPSVVINGKSLFVGEKVERAEVMSIDQESVKVLWNGEERVLTLP